MKKRRFYLWTGGLVFTIAGCLGEEPEVCNNGVDDDEDGAVDCKDTDCAAEEACALCDNGYLDTGEACDGANFGGEDCLSQGFVGGEIKCSESCKLDTSGCTVEPTEACDNGVDDDADGAVDCADEDCAQDPACGPKCNNGKLEVGEACDGKSLGGKTCQSEGFAGGHLACNPGCTLSTSGCGVPEVCNNGVDDDKDGEADCSDFECATVAPCDNLDEEVACDNLKDEDGDGLFDCEDPSACQELVICQPGNTPTGGACDTSKGCFADQNDPLCFKPEAEWPNGYCSEFCGLAAGACSGDAVCVQTGLPSGNGLCLDGCQANSDCRPGYTCQEPPAASDPPGPVCYPAGEVCGNGVDDNNNGLADCAEPDCDGDPKCVEDCANGVDDDGDGQVDCQDGLCAVAADCAEDCKNNIDDNGDSFVDCGDPQCEFGFDCDEVCDNQIDDNDNGLVDCADTKLCYWHPDCLPPEVCDNNIDDNMNGDTDCEDFDCYASCDFSTKCAAAIELTDGAPKVGVTVGGSSVFKGSCVGGVSPERLYSFTAGSPGQGGVLKLEVSSQTDLGVYVRSACADPSSELSCLDAALSSETLLMPLPGGSAVTIFVDSWVPEEAGPFTITATFIVPVCGNGVVDPLEGCDPPDGVKCDNTCHIIPDPEVSCNDLVDDDGDGLFDCQDPTNCQMTPECAPGNVPTGGPCSAASDCVANGNDPFCASEAKYGFPGGWCTEYCAVGAGVCSGDAICAEVAGPSVGHCWDTCQADGDCRAGYGCSEVGLDAMICWPQ